MTGIKKAIKKSFFKKKRVAAEDGKKKSTTNQRVITAEGLRRKLKNSLS